MLERKETDVSSLLLNKRVMNLQCALIPEKCRINPHKKRKTVQSKYVYREM